MHVCAREKERARESGRQSAAEDGLCVCVCVCLCMVGTDAQEPPACVQVCMCICLHVIHRSNRGGKIYYLLCIEKCAHTQRTIARWKHTCSDKSAIGERDAEVGYTHTHTHTHTLHETHCSDKSAIGERDAEVAAGRSLMPPDIHLKSDRERERDVDIFIRAHIYMPAYMHTYMHTVEMSRIPPSLFSTSIRRGTCVE